MPKLLLTYVVATALLVLSLRALSAPPTSNDVVVHVEKDGATFLVDAEMSIAATVDEDGTF